MTAESHVATFRHGPVSGATPVIGLRREREVLTVALQAARHVVLEGPPGTGKSTLLRAIARDLRQAVVFVEGNAELTPARLIGQYDPAQVLAEGYLAASFVDGPLLQAMRSGALLYLEEFNRVPEETLNVLITVLTEGEIAVPRLGMVHADPQFRLIAAMNPFDAIGTARVSQAIADRICRIVLEYQDAAAEREITTAVTERTGRLVEFAVSFARATRAHRDVRMGSSVRGAIDLVLLLDGLTRLRGEPVMTRDTARDAANAALSGRIRIADGCDRSPESILAELLADLWPVDEPFPRPPDSPGVFDQAAQDGQGKADGPLVPTSGPPPGSRSSLRRERRESPGRRTVSRAELASRHMAFADVSPEVGVLDQDALAALLAANPDAAAALLADLSQATDAALAAVARRLAARVFIELGAVGRRSTHGPKRMRSVPRGDGDIDLDRTVDRLAGTWPPPADDVVTQTWQARRRSVCLLVDSSGSMSGVALAMAAVATASVLLAADARLDTSALAFSGSVTLLKSPGRRELPEETVRRLLGLRGHGLTDLAAALRAAAVQLAGTSAERCVVLLSDCLSTTGADPATALAGIDRLDVLCPQPAGRAVDAESLQAAARLARLGGGVTRPVGTVAEIPAALTRLLAGR